MMIVTGGNGVLGTALREVFPVASFPERDELDMQNLDGIRQFLASLKPSVMIHAAAVTNVRLAEQERETCWDVNVAGTERLVNTLREVAPDCYFVYLSTACVFDGECGNYNETSIPQPKNYYALTKLVGEFVAKQMPTHLIVRTNFTERGPWPYPRAFSDRFGSYLFADDVADGLKDMVEERMQGLVHLAGDCKLSMLELAQINSPDIGEMTLADVDIPLTVDMTLGSIRVPHRSITRVARKRNVPMKKTAE